MIKKTVTLVAFVFVTITAFHFTWQSSRVGASEVVEQQDRSNSSSTAESNDTDGDVNLKDGERIEMGPIQAIAELADGTMAFGTAEGLQIWEDGILTSYTGNSYDPTLREMIPGDSALPSNDINCLLTADDGTLWIGTSEGLALYTNGKLINITEKLPASWNTDEIKNNAPLPSTHHDVMALYAASDGRIFIGTRNAAVIVYTPATGKYELLHKREDANQWVTDFAQDSSGTVWVSIIHLGLYQVADGKLSKFTDNRITVPLESIRSLCVNSKSLWIGTHKGLARLHDSGQLTEYSDENVLPSSMVFHLWGSDGIVWVSDFGRNHSAYRQGKWAYPNIEDAKFVSTVFQSSRGTNWVGGWNGVIYNPKITWDDERPDLAAIRKSKEAVEAAHPEKVEDAALDWRQRTWIASAHRLFRYDGDKWEELTQESNAGENHIAFVRADAKGRVFVGTSGAGLIVYSPDGVSRFNTVDNHAMTVIYDMAESDGGDLYFGTQNGVYRLHNDEWQDLTANQLTRRRYQAHPIALDSMDRLWFGDINSGLILHENGTFREMTKSHDALGGWLVERFEPLANGVMRVHMYQSTAFGNLRRAFDCNGKSVTEVEK